jgi:hypothetical protein
LIFIAKKMWLMDRLLATAKRAVELAIEANEQTALE